VEVRHARGLVRRPAPADPLLLTMSEQAGRGWRHWVPIAAWLPRYDRGWLRGDLLAGAVVAALAVPQALGYASIAGAPVQVGLYAVPLALLAYAIFGSSRQLVVGPVSTVSVLSGSFLASFGVAGTARAASYTAALALACGLVMLAAGFLGIGWVAEFLSKPIVTGFVLGLVSLVILGELPHLLGVPTPQGRVVERVGELGGSLGRGDADGTTVIISAASLLILFGGQWLARSVPWALLVLVAGLAVSNALDLSAHGVEVVGPVPRGLPTPAVPSVAAGDLPALLSSGAALALVGLAEGLSAARLFAGRGGYRIDADQELRATGAANVASGLFGGLGVAGSLSKTAAVSDARGRTQIAGLAAAALALVVIAALAPALSALPKAVLSAIVVNAVWKLMDVMALRRYAQVRRNDIVAAGIAAVGVLAFGPLYGLLLAVAVSVLGLVYRSSRVEVEVMGRVAEEKAAWGSVRDHPERATSPGIVVLRLDTPVFWVTAAPFHDAILAEVESADGVKAVVLDLEATHQMDTTSADALAELLAALRRRGVDLYLVRVMWAVRKVLRRSGLMADIGEDHLWHSISQGVREARRAHGLKRAHLDGGGPEDGAGPAEDAANSAEDAVEEHIAARSPGTADPDGARPDPAGVRFRAGNARPRDSQEADG
jgi:sulfate permease, SulP family